MTSVRHPMTMDFGVYLSYKLICYVKLNSHSRNDLNLNLSDDVSNIKQKPQNEMQVKVTFRYFEVI